MTIKLTKIEALEGRPIDNVTEGYVIEGFMGSFPAVGKSFSVLRTKRNDVERIGLFQTSPITEIEMINTGYLIQTQNSRYHMEIITDQYEEIIQLRAKVAELEQRILDDNKAYGCELMDPNGTIWEHATRLQTEAGKEKDHIAALEADKRRLDWLDDRRRCTLQKITGKIGSTFRKSIDAAMKEAAK